jgi:hypothetical protein
MQDPFHAKWLDSYRHLTYCFMPRKPKPNATTSPLATGDSPPSRRFSFDWFSDMEDHLAAALAGADALSVAAGGEFPPPLPSPLLAALPSIRLGPEFARFDQALVNPESLNFESDTSDLEEEGDAPPPAPYTSGAPGASLWNPDTTRVSIDTLHPQDLPFAGDILDLSCVLAQRTRDISHRWAEDLHDTFIAQPSGLREGSTVAMRPPSPGEDARYIFPAQPPRTVAREVRVVEHMLLTAGHWLATVDTLSVPLDVQRNLASLAVTAGAVAFRRFPGAHQHEPSCPLHHEADSTPPPPPPEGVPVSHIESPTASGSGPRGSAPSEPTRRPPRRRRKR